MTDRGYYVLALAACVVTRAADDIKWETPTERAAWIVEILERIHAQIHHAADCPGCPGHLTGDPHAD